MLAILTREIKNYIKKPFFWIGIVIVVLGIYQQISPYLSTHILLPKEEIINDYPEVVHEGEVYEGYVPLAEEERQKYWKKQLKEILSSELDMEEVETIINEIQGMDVKEASEYLEDKYNYPWVLDIYEDTIYHKGTSDEINAYITKKLENKTFSYYFSRKFTDFAGLFMGFFATILLSVLFMQDTRKNTYELLHTKPIGAKKYIIGKVGGGFVVCSISLAILNLIFWILCCVYTRNSGFEVRLWDFIESTCLYILPNMLMIICVYCLISILFKNPLPAVPFLILYMLYSNMGSKNAEGVYGYYGRPLAIMVRFPGQFFDTAPPPMVLLNQSFLILTSVIIILISIQIWKRRRM